MKKTAVIYDKWLHQFGGAEMVACHMADTLIKKGWDVTFVSGKYVHLHKSKDKFGIDLGNIPFYEVWNNEARLKKIVEGKDLFVNLSFMDYSYGYAKHNIYYTHFPTPIRGALFNTALEIFHTTGAHVLLPQNLTQRIYDRIRAGIFFDMKKRLASYDVLLANSQYSRKWIKKYWDMDSTVLYPPVSGISMDAKIPRKNWICSLGRFFTLGHGKKQEVLIEAFKKLHDKGHKNWQLHLAGGVGDEPSSIAFLQQLKDMAKGYPVFFHLNVSQDEIRQVLGQSRIYWHATGFGENENINPMAFEHFGIAPVEAIMAGCTPVLFNGGGMTEILDIFGLQKSAHSFTALDELVAKTNKLIESKITVTPVLDPKYKESLSLEAFSHNFLDLT